MPYHYTLQKWENYADPNNRNITTVEEEQQFDTLEELQKAVETDIGFVPGWLAEAPTDEYLGVEDEQGDFILDIEGAEVEK
jgi:hypothetical protein